MGQAVLLVARNPDPDSKLPYLVLLPIEGLVLKARDTWPRSSRVYCYPVEGPWPDDAEVIERVPVLEPGLRRRGLPVMTRSRRRGG